MNLRFAIRYLVYQYHRKQLGAEGYSTRAYMRPVASAFTQFAVVVDLISTIPIGSFMLIHWL